MKNTFDGSMTLCAVEFRCTLSRSTQTLQFRNQRDASAALRHRRNSTRKLVVTARHIRSRRLGIDSGKARNRAASIYIYIYTCFHSCGRSENSHSGRILSSAQACESRFNLDYVVISTFNRNADVTRESPRWREPEWFPSLVNRRPISFRRR